MLKNLKTKAYLATSAVALAPMKALAATCGPGAGQIPCVEPKPAGTITLSGIIDSIIGIVFTVVSVVALLAIVYGAFIYMTAGGDSEKTTKARNIIMYALLGVLVIAASYTLINWAMGGELFGWIVQ